MTGAGALLLLLLVLWVGWVGVGWLTGGRGRGVRRGMRRDCEGLVRGEGEHDGAARGRVGARWQHGTTASSGLAGDGAGVAIATHERSADAHGSREVGEQPSHHRVGTPQGTRAAARAEAALLPNRAV